MLYITSILFCIAIVLIYLIQLKIEKTKELENIKKLINFITDFNDFQLAGKQYIYLIDTLELQTIELNFTQYNVFKNPIIIDITDYFISVDNEIIHIENLEWEFATEQNRHETEILVAQKMLVSVDKIKK